MCKSNKGVGCEHVARRGPWRGCANTGPLGPTRRCERAVSATRWSNRGVCTGRLCMSAASTVNAVCATDGNTRRHVHPRAHTLWTSGPKGAHAFRTRQRKLNGARGVEALLMGVYINALDGLRCAIAERGITAGRFITGRQVQ